MYWGDFRGLYMIMRRIIFALTVCGLVIGTMPQAAFAAQAGSGKTKKSKKNTAASRPAQKERATKLATSGQEGDDDSEFIMVRVPKKAHKAGKKVIIECGDDQDDDQELEGTCSQKPATGKTHKKIKQSAARDQSNGEDEDDDGDDDQDEDNEQNTLIYCGTLVLKGGKAVIVLVWKTSTGVIKVTYKTVKAASWVIKTGLGIGSFALGTCFWWYPWMKTLRLHRKIPFLAKLVEKEEEAKDAAAEAILQAAKDKAKEYMTWGAVKGAFNGLFDKEKE